MTKRFYVATRKDREFEANAIAEALKSRGWERTYVWSPEEGDTLDQRAAIAQAELEGIRDADVLVVMLPGGFGTHVEIGAALALGKRVVMHAPDQETLDTPYPCVFHYHPYIKILISESIDADEIASSISQ